MCFILLPRYRYIFVFVTQIKIHFNYRQIENKLESEAQDEWQQQKMRGSGCVFFKDYQY